MIRRRNSINWRHCSRLPSTAAEDCSLIADLLSLPDPGRFQTLNLSPQQRKSRTLQALVQQLEALARRQPVLMIFEDVHWIDPTSLELLDRTVERIRLLPVLLIVTFRPEFTPPWTGQPHASMMMLNRLGESDGIALVKRVLGERDLSAELYERSSSAPTACRFISRNLRKRWLKPARRTTRHCRRHVDLVSPPPCTLPSWPVSIGWARRKSGADRCGNRAGILARPFGRSGTVFGN